MRSLLMARADSAACLDQALASRADAVVIDLASTAAPDIVAARLAARGFLASARRTSPRPRLIARVHDLGSGLIADDLAAVMPSAPDAIVLPNCRGGVDVQRLSVKLAVLEAEHGLADGSTLIIAMAAETPESIFGLGAYAGASARLAGLGWSAEALGRSIGARTSRLDSGDVIEPLRLARSLTLFGARSARVAPIDTAFVDRLDPTGLRAECENARRDGFVGKFAIHPAQVDIINDIFASAPPE